MALSKRSSFPALNASLRAALPHAPLLFVLSIAFLVYYPTVGASLHGDDYLAFIDVTSKDFPDFIHDVLHHTDSNVAWARDFFAAMERFGTGMTNLNFPGLGEDLGFIRAGFGGNYERLVAVKQKYDPTNLFRFNQNIRPAG